MEGDLEIIVEENEHTSGSIGIRYIWNIIKNSIAKHSSQLLKINYWHYDKDAMKIKMLMKDFSARKYKLGINKSGIISSFENIFKIFSMLWGH